MHSGNRVSGYRIQKSDWPSDCVVLSVITATFTGPRRKSCKQKKPRGPRLRVQRIVIWRYPFSNPAVSLVLCFVAEGCRCYVNGFLCLVPGGYIHIVFLNTFVSWDPAMRKFSAQIVNVQIVATLYCPSEQAVFRYRWISIKRQVVDGHSVGSLHHRVEFSCEFLLRSFVQR